MSWTWMFEWKSANSLRPKKTRQVKSKFNSLLSICSQRIGPGRPKTFFSKGIKKVIQHWTKCIEEQWLILKNGINISFLFVLK
jgi:hypothetical protein